MRPAMADLEALRLREVEEEYRAKGYDVVPSPQGDQLPEWLASYRPDLLARKGDDAVVVEVKSLASLASDAKLQHLAKAVRAQPGWRLDLIVVGQRGRELIADGAEEWNEGDVARGLAEVDALLAAGHTEAALLLAWSATEATLRLLAAGDEIELKRQDPPYLLKQLAFNAVIAREEYDLLWEAMRLRNAVAHGLKPARLDPAQVRTLAETAARLLRAEELRVTEAM
jgi:REase_AHJR-like